MEIPAHLQNAINKILAGEATPEETRQVRDWYYSLPNEAIVDSDESDMRSVLQHRMLDHIDQVLFTQEIPVMVNAPVHKPVIRKYYRLTAAAAILLLLSVGAVYWFNRSDRNSSVATTTNPYPIENDVAPGGNKATLQLANGEIYVLDNTVTGTSLERQGMKITKLDSGTLAYTTTDAYSATSAPAFNTISVPRGGQFKMVLPDGSNVWLNAASTLRFPTSFSGKVREVELMGEGYFEVAKNPAKPFHVKVNKMEIEVLGTHFNISAYEEENKPTTTLLEGKVKVTADGVAKPQMLAPGQQAMLSKQGSISVRSDVDVTEAVSWKDGYFQFNKVPLSAVMRQLARWYDVDIRYEGNVKDEAIVGKYSRQANLSQTLQFLKLIDVHFRIENKTIVLLP